VFGARVCAPDPAAGDRACDEVCAGLDAIGQTLVAAPCSASTPSIDDRVGALSRDLRAHRRQELSQVDDLGLARCVLEDRAAFRQRGRHHEVLSTL
jgi:hypothetical protein